MGGSRQYGDSDSQAGPDLGPSENACRTRCKLDLMHRSDLENLAAVIMPYAKGLFHQIVTFTVLHRYGELDGVSNSTNEVPALQIS